METKYVPLTESMNQLRAELKREFPATKFSVTRGRGTGYGYVDLSWTDGPTDARVREIANGYEGEGFDGMTDSSYSIEHTAADAHGNPVRIRHGIRSILTQRTITANTARRCLAQVVDYFGADAVPFVVEKTGWNGKPTWELSEPRATCKATGEWWSTMIYRAAENATRYAFRAN